MGTWNTGILDNDGAMDVYGYFENLYNKQEVDIAHIKQKTLSKFGLINENNQPVYGNEEWLAYAQICWECKSLDEQTIAAVRGILNDKAGIAEEWEGLADKRMEVITAFLSKIQTPSKRKKTIKKEFNVHVPFQEGDCVVVRCEDGMYSAVILLDIDKKHVDEPNRWSYFFGMTRIYSETEPTFEEIVNNHFMVVNYGKSHENETANWIKEPRLWIRGAAIGPIKNNEEKQKMEDKINSYKIVGRVKMSSKPVYQLFYGHFHLDDSHQLKSQTAWEKEHPNSADLAYPVKKYITDGPGDRPKKGWQFWK